MCPALFFSFEVLGFELRVSSFARQELYHFSHCTSYTAILK
jgi:hypothetical protein